MDVNYIIYIHDEFVKKNAFFGVRLAYFALRLR